MIRILLVDDHAVVRRGLVSILETDGELEVAAEADTAEGALAALKKKDVEVAVIDIRLPGMSGIDASSIIAKRYPDVGILILTSFPDEQAMIAAFTAGARGFVKKESPESLVREAIRSVAAGGTFIDPSLGARLIALATRGLDPKGPYELTRQEMRVLSYMPRGFSNRDIAESLGLSEQTVKTHVRGILRKLNVKDRAQAAAVAVREDLV